MAFAYLDSERPYGIAHRGGTGVAPENTIAAFAAAVDLGFQYLETDVHLTADGEIVAFHDPDLERVAGTAATIASLTWPQIAAIELAGGHRIPRLIELLETFPESRFNIDPKSDDVVEPLIAMLSDQQALARIGIGSFSDTRISRMREGLGPDLCTSPGPKGVAKIVIAAIAGLRLPLPYGCVQIPWKFRGIRTGRPWLIRRIQALGLQVHFWTVNDSDEMVRLLNAGADAIITDEVVQLAELLQERRHPG